MKPGRKLDALVAEKVFGRKVIETDDCNGDDNLWLHSGCDKCADEEELPHYSADINAAWEVFQTIAKRWEDPWAGFVFDGKTLIWRCHFSRQIPGGIVDEASAHAATAPHAICLAALKAVEGK